MKSRTCSKPRRLAANEPTDSGAVLQAHAEHLLHQRRRDLDVDARAGLVDEVAAQQAHEQVGADHQHHADRQRPQRLDRVVRHDAVVDVHREHRQGEREDVDQQRGPRARRGRRSAARAPRPRTSGALAARRRRRPPRCARRSGSAGGRTAPRRCSGASSSSRGSVTEPWPVSGISTRASPPASAVQPSSTQALLSFRIRIAGSAAVSI